MAGGGWIGSVLGRVALRLLAAWLDCLRCIVASLRAWIVRLFGGAVRRRRSKAMAEPADFDLDTELTKRQAPWRRTRRKPVWVEQEVIKLRALGFKLGYGKIAEIFNRRFAAFGECVSKNTVKRIVLRRREAVRALRRAFKHRPPRTVSKNAVWGMDLCTVTDASKRQRLVLGIGRSRLPASRDTCTSMCIVDHGTRACLTLVELKDKGALTILREVIGVIRRYSVPGSVRTDNETSFTSRVLRAPLKLLGVRRQTTDPGCPWQNGRIERLFGTFKRAIRQIVVIGDDLPLRLMQFRAVHNFARTHDNLGGRTPAEAWSGVRKRNGEAEFVSAWSGVLQGWYFPLRE